MSAAPHRVLKESALSIGGMKPVWVGKTKLLLVRQRDGTVHAVQPLCPHYQMPLSDGLLCEGVLHCSWHQSRFDLSSGAVLDPPALSPLKTYPARVQGGWIYVTLDATPRPDHADRATGSCVVVLGGGAAGAAAALRLREQGFAGRLVQVMAEPFAPYDRPNLSKEHLSGHVRPRELPLPAVPGVVRVHRRAVGVDPAAKAVRFDDRSSMTYDRLLLAPGSIPVTLGVPGEEMTNVFALRSRSDGERLASAARCSRRAVVVGSSFIGMEVAAALRERGLRVTVVTSERAPFARTLGAEVGGYFRRLHEKRGIGFRFQSKVEVFTGRRRADGVILNTGEHLPANLIVVGVGVRPATDWLPTAWRDRAGRLPVEASLALPGTQGTIFAAGDVAVLPDPLTGSPFHVEHWRVAEQQGRLAADNLLASLEGRRMDSFRSVPYFWSYQLGQGLDFVGHATAWDEVIIDGHLAGGDFIAYYRQGERVPAAASVGRSLAMTAMLEWMTRHGSPSAELIRRQPDWVSLACPTGRD